MATPDISINHVKSAQFNKNMACVERVQYEGGEVYDGQWSEEGRRHGTGRLSFSDGSNYKGQFSAGFFHVRSTLSLDRLL